ncbi:hypothetical protein Mgra_00002769 [Meloidogyne graminicola]|uniref:Ground-like domain-containing protein n=1 Tax=Meloidogyne graminicola TaxID=189291 RepID=A0A8S9ZXM9_9BILA|nr:hypothetical protein Mgra_00002769 [Meloidogyne graminicola]
MFKLNLIFIILYIFTLFKSNNCCGFPVQQSAPVCICGGGGGGYGCGGGGGGGGGCCGRKKREAIKPYFKGIENPCPQKEWKLILEKAINSNNDPITSTNAIHTSLFNHYPNNKFIVTCDKIIKKNKDEENNIKNLPNFSASGDGYCNIFNKNIWCQTVAIQA